MNPADDDICPPCHCVVKNRVKGETQREWFKRWMCMFHWIQTDYYQAKLDEGKRDYEVERRSP